MYIPKHFEETNVATLHELIQSHPLGAWVTYSEGELVANHIPFLLDAARGEHGTLIGHVARANPIWRSLSSDADSLVMFQGPNAYISPSWYPSKQNAGEVVPTWNYAIVHTHGRARAIQDRDWLHDVVQRLTNTHEANQTYPWKVSDAPHDYIQRMLGSIVGIEIPLSKLTGKWKVSQNRPTEDKLGVVAGLLASDNSAATAMSELVQRHIQV
jgi:transcriptional regulator